MNTPIINPAILTQEQRIEIKEQYRINADLTPSEVQNAYQIGVTHALEWLFSKSMFESSAEPPCQVKKEE